MAADPGRGEPRAPAVIACGALAAAVRRTLRNEGIDAEVVALPPVLHDRPAEIAPAVERLAAALGSEGRPVAVAYADCGTYGGLDEVCSARGLPRLAGLHCYDVMAGPSAVRHLLEEEPGTYLLTDFLVRSFGRTVERELGLDRHPELVEDYFGNYRRVVWLAEQPSPELWRAATAIAARLGLPLVVRVVGTWRFGRKVVALVEAAGRAPAGTE